jgi:DNA-binding transcriptional MocR family regulator
MSSASRGQSAKGSLFDHQGPNGTVSPTEMDQESPDVRLHEMELPAACRFPPNDRNRVIYVRGFSKTLTGALRVGFVACSRDTANQLADIKMLTSITTPKVRPRDGRSPMSVRRT